MVNKPLIRPAISGVARIPMIFPSKVRWGGVG